MKMLFVLIFLLVAYNHWEISKYKLARLDLKSDKITGDLKIVQISDFHSSNYIDQENLLLDIYEEEPDLIVLTGDLIDGRKEDIGPSLDLIDRLRTLDLDIYFVTGNHEYRNINFDRFMEGLRVRGVKVLDNRVEFIEAYNISLGGVNFGLSQDHYNEVTSFMTEETYNILLSHGPSYPLEYTRGLEDLVLCGHTHGGQVRLPLIGAILSPSEGIFPKYDKGVYDLGQGQIYIDSGLGTTALALRLFNRAQISIIRISS